jgi:hypothetical protein
MTLFEKFTGHCHIMILVILIVINFNLGVVNKKARANALDLKCYVS